MARRFTDLYRRIIGFDTLWYACRAAVKGKRTKDEVARFEFHVEERLLELEHDLTARTYRPGAYRSFYIRDPKRRLISAAPFRDRVVHHALCQVIEPLFERTFIADSFANRVGRGTHAALDRAEHWAAGGGARRCRRTRGRRSPRPPRSPDGALAQSGSGSGLEVEASAGCGAAR